MGNQEIGELVIIDPNSGIALWVKGQSAVNDEFIERLSKGIVEGLIEGVKP